MATLLVCGITEALSDIKPGAQWVMNGELYSGLEWLDKNQSKPTNKEVQDGVAACELRRLQDEALKRQAILDVQNTTKTDQERIDALIKVIDLK